MRTFLWVLLGVTVVLLLVYVFLLIVRPTIVLPTYTISGANNSIAPLQQQLNVNQLDLRIRSDGKVDIIGDGKDLGTVSYTPATLRNALALGAKYSNSSDKIRLLGILPYAFPGLVTNSIILGGALTSILPLEMTVRFLSG